MNKFYHKKFTIIELFIAIAIIALLAAILLPSLFQARVKAHMANDISNLRQVYQAFIYYAEENNGYLPYIQSISRVCPYTSISLINRKICYILMC